MGRKIVFFELNEVPFRILDAFCTWRPDSTLARRLGGMSQYESYAEDEVDLSPWITWPTVHRGVTYAHHGIRAFGQVLDEIDEVHPPIWRILTEAGVSTGVFGSLHSYPPPASHDGYAFFLPDTFAAGPEAYPEALSIFQEFNLSMARESGRNVSTRIPAVSTARFLANAPRLGFRARTAAQIARQLLDERRDPFTRVRRRTYQSVLGFDIFMKQLRSAKPDFVTFFTNHVASAMHRYWAASFPGDYDVMGYDDAWLARWDEEIPFAVEKFDAMLADLLAFVDRNPEYVLVVSSSMGQAATATHRMRTHLTITDLGRFMAQMGLEPHEWERRPAMEPDVNVVAKPGAVDRLRAALAALRIADQPFMAREKDHGFFNLVLGRGDLGPPFAELRGEKLSLADLGLEHAAVEDEAGGCAYHVPEGILLVYDPRGGGCEASRQRISTTDIAPTLLENFSLPIPGYMAKPGAFRLGAR